MKRTILSLMTVLLLSVLNPATVHAATEIKKEVTAPITTQEQADVLISRLYEINEIDKTGLTSSEKKTLRNEVLAIRDKVLNGPVLVISGGALLLLIILLIILL